MNDTDTLNKEPGAKIDYNVIELDIEGMDCPSCAMKIERRLNKLSGIKNAKVDLANETASFVITGSETNLEFVKGEIDKLGYKAIEQENDEDEETAEAEKLKARSLFKKKIITSITLSVIIVILGMIAGLIMRNIKKYGSFSAYIQSLKKDTYFKRISL